MVRHAAARLNNPDRQLNVIMRDTWIQLPPDLRRTATNIAAIRLGVIAYALILPASIGSKIASSTPDEFARYLAGLTPILGLIGLIAATIILYMRATRTNPRFVAAYTEIMPGYVERIEQRYGVPGLGDVFAPWIRSRHGILKRIFGRLAMRFQIRP